MADEDAQASLQKIKRQLSSASSTVLMEGSLLKRSETLRKWNQRWFILDPTSGKMEYRVQQGDASVRGLIFFDADSTITVSPINFHGAKKYDGCCLYIGTPQKKEYYLCAETPGAARAWVATLRAAALVLKAHKEAVDSLGGSGHAKLGTVAAVVAAANATAREGVKEIHFSMKAAVKTNASQGSAGSVDDMSLVMKETLRVKDEELNQISRDLRARDYTIKEMADRLTETAEAAEAAASAARSMDKERKLVQAEMDHLRREFDEKIRHAARELRAGDEALAILSKAKDSALQEAQRWRVELGKGREQVVLMEAAVVRAEESARRAAADAEERLRISQENEKRALAAKDEAGQQAKNWKMQAEYYQSQAARYLSMLQGKELPEEETKDHTGEVGQEYLGDVQDFEICDQNVLLGILPNGIPPSLDTGKRETADVDSAPTVISVSRDELENKLPLPPALATGDGHMADSLDASKPPDPSTIMDLNQLPTFIPINSGAQDGILHYTD